LEAGEPGAIQWARQLQAEVTADQDAYRHDEGWAFETLAEIHRGSGQWELAVRALEQASAVTGPSMSGTSGLPDLTMAEILLENDPGSLSRVADLLNSPALTGRLRFNSELFRYHLAAARALQQLCQDPGPPARRALALLENDEPQLPRHPGVGRIHASEQTVRELRDLARA
jgi:hypothetical protein